MRKSALGAILTSFHTALVVYAVYTAVVDPPERSAAWSLLEVADRPVIVVVRFFADPLNPSFGPSGFFVLGNVQWFVIGFALQALVQRLIILTRRSPNNALQRTQAGGGAGSEFEP